MPTASSDTVGLYFVLALIAASLGVILYSSVPRPLKTILCVGLALRVIGGLARYSVLEVFYDGRGDAVRYYRVGLEYAERFRALDFSPLSDPSLWHSQTWWGTQFMFFPSGFVLAVIGPTMLGEFIVFSIFAFLGLVALVVAYTRAFPQVATSRYAAWLLLFPSLWFWPSSVGKESIMLFGIGMATLGFVGKHGRISVFPLAAGLATMLSLRPQVAALFILCAALAHWLTRQHKWSFARVLQGVAILAVGLTSVWYAGRELGIDSFDAEGLQDFVASDPARRVRGGSAIEAVSLGWSAAPLAAINVLFRPFPWEADSPLMLLSSAEITGLWLLLLWRRRSVSATVRRWRSSRFIAFALAFSLIYAIALGLMMSNLAIIARQRVFFFPFLFLLLEAAPAAARAAHARDSLRTASRHLLVTPN
ncbi:MAG: hypothetical protein AB1762_18115 [Gemmatimonadota bacterium]